MIIALRGRGQRHVGFRNRADRPMDHVELDFGGRKPRERVRQRFDRAVDVALDDDAQLFDFAREHPLAQIFERNAAGLLQYAFALLGPAEFRDLARLGFLDHRGKCSAGLGHARKAENLHRRRRTGLGHALAEMVLHRAHAAIAGTANERVALMRACLPGSARSRPARGRGRVPIRPPCHARGDRDSPSIPSCRPAAGSFRAGARRPRRVRAETGTTMVSPP